jgi:hypothetical protein
VLKGWIFVQKWLLPTLSEILVRSQQPETDDFEQFPPAAYGGGDRSRLLRQQLKAEREWCGAIAALEQLLLSEIAPEESLVKGLVLVSPAPVLSNSLLNHRLKTAIFSAEQFHGLALMPFQLPLEENLPPALTTEYPYTLPLLLADPLVAEQFCLVLTAKFSLVLVLGTDRHHFPAFLFSFDPEVVQIAWEALRHRILIGDRRAILPQLDALVDQFFPVAPDYRTVTQFSRLLLQYLPAEVKTEKPVKNKRLELQKNKPYAIGRNAPYKLLPTGFNFSYERGENEIPVNTETVFPPDGDIELLQAFAHEVRTPLTTIRTLIRLLLRRSDLPPDVIKRLETIDRECSEQIDRMELIFRAVELETTKVKEDLVNLTATPVDSLLKNSIPRWQKQASRRNLTLDVELPKKLPNIASNPAMLDQVLTGLIENFTSNLPSGSHVQVQVTLAGDRLKLQLLSQAHPGDFSKFAASGTGKSLGQLLAFQPETGNISLNLNATKNLFQALGGKLIVRQRPQEGEVLTIFLPLH